MDARSPRLPALDLANAPDAEALGRLVPWRDAMRACIQDPVHHAEGDVWTHTLMVCAALAADPAFAAMPDADREVLSWAALLHDVAKPATREETYDEAEGRVRVGHPRHAPRGARMAHAHLYRMGAPAALRSAVHALVDGHQAIFHLMSQDDWEDRIARRSLSRRWDLQIALARADTRGRTCRDAARSLEGIDIVEMAVREAGCLGAPQRFASPAARVAFGRDPGASRFREPHPPAGSRVVVLSGLPGVGKDTHAAAAFPGVEVISFDALRRAMGFRHGDRDGAALQAAFEAAKACLRKGTPFVWNATGITRSRRDRIVALCLAYDAHVEIRVLDAPYPVVLARNAARQSAIPADALERMVDAWEPVQPFEAHEVRVVDVSPRAKPGRAPAPDGDAEASSTPGAAGP